MKNKYNVGEDNPMFGKKHSEETLRKMRSVKLGEKNPLWRGDEVRYGALHDWIKTRKPRPDVCERCQIKPPFDLTCMDDRYTRNLNDWQWLCRRCHMITDGRILNLKRGR